MTRVEWIVKQLGESYFPIEFIKVMLLKVEAEGVDLTEEQPAYESESWIVYPYEGRH